MFNSFIVIFNFIIFLSLPVNARCAVCYTDGLSGASIAILVILSSAIFLFIANKYLRKFLEKNFF